MAHIHDKIDFTTSIYIVRDNKVLLHMHKKLNIWLPPGGHIELDEDPNQAAIREAKEETGLDVTLVGEGRAYETVYESQDLIAPRFLNKHFYYSKEERASGAITHQHVDLGYIARPVGDAAARHEVEGGVVKWFSREELESAEYDVVADVRFHALTALEALAS